MLLSSADSSPAYVTTHVRATCLHTCELWGETHRVAIMTPLSRLSLVSFDARYTLQTKRAALSPVLCHVCTCMCTPFIICPLERGHKG